MRLGLRPDLLAQRVFDKGYPWELLMASVSEQLSLSP